MAATGRTIVFLSDFGYRNEWVGICHAVMSRIAPESPIVDLSHGVPPLDVRGGALLLVDSLPDLAADAIVLAIVDPSVGRDRDVALETGAGRRGVGGATYADVASGDWGLIVDPRGWLSVVRGNPANAAEGLGSVAPGDPVWLTAGGH